MDKRNGLYLIGGPNVPVISWLDQCRAAGFELRMASEDPADYRSLPDREQVELLICRQGVVNDVLAYYPNVKWLQQEHCWDESEIPTIYGDLKDRVLGESDFVVTSLPVTEETRDIINSRTLSMMKPTAFLINVARGHIIDEAALIEALNSGVIAGAALDVTKQEPLPADDPLWHAKNILIKPHCAAYGNQMPLRMREMILRNPQNYLDGNSMENLVKL